MFFIETLTKYTNTKIKANECTFFFLGSLFSSLLKLTCVLLRIPINYKQSFYTFKFPAKVASLIKTRYFGFEDIQIYKFLCNKGNKNRHVFMLLD